MPNKEFRISNPRGGSAITVLVKPRASQDRITEINDDGTLQIELTCEDFQETINISLIKFLADVLTVPRQKIEILAGEDGSKKLVSILDMRAEITQQKILAQVESI
jgi:uncharacterized protein YggU (UPF0235/DUF167 family)